MVLLLMSAAVLSPANSEVGSAGQCHRVTGTYAIYVNHDLLHIDGSRHFVEVKSDKLDAELQRRGWENTIARGRFTICGPGVGNPQRLNVQDRVELRSWTDMRYLSRKTRK